MNLAVWNKAQQQGEQELAAKQFVANVHKQSGTSGLYMPDGSLKPQAAQAADWVPQAMAGGPIAADILGTAAGIPLGAGVNLGGVANAAGLSYGATQVDDRYKDWQDVAAGNMDWKEAALKTGLTGLDFAGAGIPIKNASNIIKTMNAPTFTKGKTLIGNPTAKKVLGTIDEYGDLTDGSGVTVYGASSPIGGNSSKLNKQFIDPEAPAISLKDWENAKKLAEISNERFIIPKAEEQFLVHKYADEFASKFNIPVEKLNPKDVGLYGKLKESKFIPTRETIKAAEGESMPAISKKIHSDFLQTHKPNLDLTTEEELVLDAYARGYDRLINARESEKAAPFYQEEIAPMLEKSILKSKFQQPQTLIRGTRNFDINNGASVIRNGETLQDLKFSDLKEGDLFVPKSFTSTSITRNKPETTLGFEAPLTGFTERAENLDYVINAPAGQSYLYPNASNIQHFPQEMEAILPKDLQFKLDRIASDVERGYLGTAADIQRGKLYNGFTKMPNKYFPSISKFDKIVDLKGNRIPKKNIPKVIDYHNKLFQPSIPKYYFSIANPYLFGGKLEQGGPLGEPVTPVQPTTPPDTNPANPTAVNAAGVQDFYTNWYSKRTLPFAEIGNKQYEKVMRSVLPAYNPQSPLLNDITQKAVPYEVQPMIEGDPTATGALVYNKQGIPEKIQLKESILSNPKELDSTLVHEEHTRIMNPFADKVLPVEQMIINPSIKTFEEGWGNLKGDAADAAGEYYDYITDPQGGNIQSMLFEVRKSKNLQPNQVITDQDIESWKQEAEQSGALDPNNANYDNALYNLFKLGKDNASIKNLFNYIASNKTQQPNAMSGSMNNMG
jgi:hypothetical protein